jgi:predicted Fe-Mo cluster-binding NifX family protein
MKVAVTAQQEELDSTIDPRFGRAQYFVVYDTETDDTGAHSNEQNVQAQQGAGIQAAENVARLGAEVVLTGHVGPKAFHTLRAAGIAVCLGASGTVREAIEAYRQGKLQPVEQPDVAGHWM